MGILKRGRVLSCVLALSVGLGGAPAPARAQGGAGVTIGSSSSRMGERYAPIASQHAMTLAERRAQVAQSRAAEAVSVRQKVVSITSTKSVRPVPVHKTSVGPRTGQSPFLETEGWVKDADGSTVGSGIWGNPGAYVGATVPGTQVTFTQDIVATGSVAGPIHLLWRPLCGSLEHPGSGISDGTIYDLGQTVTPPVSASGPGPTFSITLNLPTLTL